MALDIMKIKSPITNKNNASKIDNINVEKIFKSYEKAGITNIQRFFTELETVLIFKCLDTGYRFYYPFNIFGDDEFYSYLQEQRKYYADWRWEHGKAYSLIKSGHKVLEIGCGTGNFMSKIKKEKGAECIGLELNQQALEEGKKRGLSILSQTIEKHSQDNKDKYDAVCIFQVLEHVWDVRPFLEGAIASLKRGGLLIVGVPNNNPYLFRYDKYHALNLPPHHAGLWDRKSLISLAEFFDVRVEKIEIEPLFEADYFWNIQRQYWMKHNKMLYYITNLIPKTWNDLRNDLLRKKFDGRNILAVYSKQ